MTMSLQQQPVFYAHTLPDQPEKRWERLEVHLKEVAELAKIEEGFVRSTSVRRERCV
jgi:hypothetical protein